jgi:hypothetical protein
VRQVRALEIFDKARASWNANRVAFPDFDRTTTYCCISIVNDWSEFSRAYVLSCIRAPVRLVRPPITYGNTAITTEVAVLELACLRCRKRKVPNPNRNEEPKWHRPRTVRDTLAELNASHIADVDAAQNHRPDDLTAMVDIRNFFAHRNSETKTIALAHAMRYLIPRPIHPAHFLASQSAQTNKLPVLNFLVEGLLETAELMCR